MADKTTLKFARYEAFEEAGRIVDKQMEGFKKLFGTTNPKAGRWVFVPEKISNEMIEAAMEAHYGKRRVRAHGGAKGIDMTVNDKHYDGYEAMRRLWKGALSVVPSTQASTNRELDEREAFESWFNGLPKDEEGFAIIKGFRVNYGMALAGWMARSAKVGK